MKLTRPFAMVEKDVLFSPEMTALENWFTVFCAPFPITTPAPATHPIIPLQRKLAVLKRLLYSVSLRCVKKVGCKKWNNGQRKAVIAAICIFLFCHQKNNTSTLATQNRNPLLNRKNQILRLMANHIGVIQNGWKMLKIELNIITLRNICQISFIWWISFASVSQSFMILLSLKTENC